MPGPRENHITSGHVRAFQLVTSGQADLWPCRVNGEGGVAVVLVDHDGQGRLAVMPLFVALTASMEVVFEGETGSRSGGGGGGPTDPREAFEAGKAGVTGPAPA